MMRIGVEMLRSRAGVVVVVEGRREVTRSWTMEEARRGEFVRVTWLRREPVPMADSMFSVERIGVVVDTEGLVSRLMFANERNSKPTCA